MEFTISHLFLNCGIVLFSEGKLKVFPSLCYLSQTYFNISICSHKARRKKLNYFVCM